MNPLVEDHIARRLKEMETTGELKANPLKGKPLDLQDYFRSPKETRAVDRYLADNGYEPPKLQMLKQIKELEEEYRRQPSVELKRKLNSLRLKYNLMRS